MIHFLLLEALLNLIPMTQQHPEVPGLSSLTKLLLSRKRNTENDTELGGGRERFLLEAVKVVAMRPSPANTGTAASVRLINRTSCIIPFLSAFPPPPQHSFCSCLRSEEAPATCFFFPFAPFFCLVQDGARKWNYQLLQQFFSRLQRVQGGDARSGGSWQKR